MALREILWPVSLVAAAMLWLDLRAARDERAVGSLFRTALRAMAWVALAAATGAMVGAHQGAAAAHAFWACYLKSLSLDHLLVFVAVFRRHPIPVLAQHRVLVWGVVLSIILRAFAVMLGSVVLALGSWAAVPFGALLLVYGAKMAATYRKPPVVLLKAGASGGWLRRYVPVSPQVHGLRLVVREGGQWRATPLLMVLVGLESVDVLFMLDEIPAMLAVTRDTGIVLLANALAVLGLRALYFVAAPFVERLLPMRLAAGVLLAFAGVKLLAKPWLVVSPTHTLAVVTIVVAVALVISLARGEALSAPSP